MKQNPWLWMSLATPGFAIGFPLTKRLFDTGLSVWEINVPRFVIATIAVWIALAAGQRKVQHAWRRGMALGVINMALTSLLVGLGTDLLPSSVAGILTAFIPLATATAAHWIVVDERFSMVRVPGAVVATIGAVALVLGGSSDGGRPSILGVALVLMGVGFAGAGGALNRRFTQETGVAALVVPQYVGATAMFVAFGAPLGGLTPGALSAEQWWLLLALALPCTALPFVAILKAFQMTSAARASLVGYLVPFLAAAFSVILLGETITLSFVIGGTLIIAGVVMADRSERRVRLAAPV